MIQLLSSAFLVAVIGTAGFAAQTREVRPDPPCPTTPFFQKDVKATARQRQEFATYLAAPMQRFYDAVPKLSPAEQKWLNGELNTGIGARVGPAANSAEYYKSVANEHGSFRLSILHSLASGKAGESEMFLWAGLAHSYGEREFAYSLAGLVEKKVIEDRCVYT